MPVSKSYDGGGVASSATFTAPSAFATPNRPGKSAAFTSKSNRFTTPTSQGGGSSSYDVTTGTMGASASKKSFNKSGGGGFGGTAKRDTGSWGARQATPRSARQPRSEATAPSFSSFGGKKVGSKGPSSAFGGGKDRFAPKRQAAPDSGYTPAGMGTVKRTTAKSAVMGGGKERFAPVKAAAPDYYGDAFTSDFSTKATSKSFNKSIAKNGAGFGGRQERKSAVEEAAVAAAKNAPDAIYNPYASTGAFSAVAKSGSGAKPSAAFASKSSKHAEVTRSDAPDPGLYDAYGSASMAQTSKSFNKAINAGAGGFGTSAKRETGPALASDDYTPGPGAYVPDHSAFDAGGSRQPSAAFASASGAGARLAAVDVSEAPSGPMYDPHSSDGMAVTATKTFNKGGGTMGRSERMEKVREAAPGDYSDGLLGAGISSAAKSASALPNMGFGGMASRSSLFEDAAAARANTGGADSYYVGGGAFEVSKGPSAAFKASDRGLGPSTKALAEVGDPGAYDPYSGSSLAAQTSKSFNKAVQRGAGGFGTSAKRSELSVPSDAPGPGAYDSTSGLFERDGYQQPSSAFASASEARPELRASSAPSGVDYDVETDGLGMAAAASRTFNHGRVGGFGAAAPRQLHSKANAAPGPGQYDGADPSAPTVGSQLKATKGRMSSAFASADMRDTDDWATLSMFNK